MAKTPVQAFEPMTLYTPETSVKQLSQQQVEQDITTFAQMLITIYGGWPFYSETLRRNILNQINDIYENADKKISADDLFDMLSHIINIMPDKHLWIKLGDKLTLNRAPRINVGENLAKTYGNDKPYFIDKIDDIGIIALSKCFAPDDDAHFEKFKQLVHNVMNNTRAIIIDMRDNGGGSPALTVMIGNELNGIDIVPRFERIFLRTTPQAQSLYKHIMLPLDHVDLSKDPILYVDNSKFKMPKNHKFAYNNPIYILQNNRSCSSAELLQTFLRFNKNMQIVGSQSAGCRQYTNYKHFVLEHSKIMIQLALVFAEIPGIKHFEMHGHKPDIVVPDGTDAFSVVMSKINTKGK